MSVLSRVKVKTKSGICSIFLTKVFFLHQNFLSHESVLFLCAGSSVEKILMKRENFSEYMKKKTGNGSSYDLDNIPIVKWKLKKINIDGNSLY